jgi:putative flavoprotein involved in K+ transport
LIGGQIVYPRYSNPYGTHTLEVLVIGAGQAGLATSYFLSRRGIGHVVLERGRIGQSWRSQRWDSFVVNTPNWLNALPGTGYVGPTPDGFHARDELVASFEDYVRRFNLPVRSGIEVEALEPDREAAGFAVRARSVDGRHESMRAYNVVVASGMLQKPKVPAFATALPANIYQLHTSDYRNPGQLPPGSVVVVGSGQSGCQIAEELAEAGRRVYLCTSRVGRQPRRYRGRDIVEWEWESGILHVTRDELDDPAMVTAPQPQISGVGRFGHTISLQQLHRAGVTLLGRIVDIRDNSLILDDSLRDNIRFADQASTDCKREIDAYIAREGISAPAPEPDPADRAWEDLEALPMPERLELAQADVGGVIWSTGFTADFSWIDLPVIDAAGRPLHNRGIAPTNGIYFVGFPWLHRRKSGIICGVEEDASHVVQHIVMRRARTVERESPKPGHPSSSNAHTAQV